MRGFAVLLFCYVAAVFIVDVAPVHGDNLQERNRLVKRYAVKEEIDDDTEETSSENSKENSANKYPTLADLNFEISNEIPDDEYVNELENYILKVAQRYIVKDQSDLPQPHYHYKPIPIQSQYVQSAGGTGVEGRIRSTSGNVIPHARLNINGNEYPIGGNGNYWVSLAPGIYRITVSANGYEPWTETVRIEPNSGRVIVDFILLRYNPRYQDPSYWN